MSARPPRAATRGGAQGERRAKTRGGTQGERAAKPKRRAGSTAVATNPFVRIDDPRLAGRLEDAEILEEDVLDEDVLEVEDKVVVDTVSLARASSDMASVDVDVDDDDSADGAPSDPTNARGVAAPNGPAQRPSAQNAGDPRAVAPLRLAILEAGPHLDSAQAAIVAAGHTILATGRDGVERVRAGASDIDAVLVGLPGGEALIDELTARDQRPLIIAACTSGALDATRRAAAAGADLATVRPHHVERLSPILLAAARLVAQRRASAGREGTGRSPGKDASFIAAGTIGRSRADSVDPDADDSFDVLMSADFDSESDGDSESGTLQAFTVFQRTAELEIARSRKYAYPLCMAVFRVDIPHQPAPPPGVPGILRARAGNAIVNALRDIDIATELDRDRFAVLMPHTDRLVGADIARRIISAVANGDPVTLGGRTLPPKVIGAVAAARPADAAAFTHLLEEATQLLEQAQVTGASLAVET